MTATIHPIKNAPGQGTSSAEGAADDLERKSQAMTHSVKPGAPAPNTRRGRQLAATIAQEHLINHNLPEMIAWRVGLNGVFGQLDVHLVSAERRRELMQDWATFLGGTVAYDSGIGAQFPQLRVIATYRGVNVEIWCPAEPTPERRAS